eukprot:3890738-Rhodomonas_salina.1
MSRAYLVAWTVAAETAIQTRRTQLRSERRAALTETADKLVRRMCQDVGRPGSRWIRQILGRCNVMADQWGI